MDNTSQMSQPARLPARTLRWMLIILALGLLVLVFSGCTSSALPTLNKSQFDTLGQNMAAVENQVVADEARLATSNLQGITVDENATLTKAVPNIAIDSTAPNDKAQVLFLKGYIREFKGNYADARTAYEQAAGVKSGYATQALYRLGVLGANDKLGTHDESMKIAKSSLHRLTTPPTDAKVWVRDPAVAGTPVGGKKVAELATAAPTPGSLKSPALYPQAATPLALQVLDNLYKYGGGTDTIKYRAVDAIVSVFRRISPHYGVVLALIFLALLVKVVTIPMTTASYRGMRDMAKIQPLLKELQEKYKDDKAKFAEEQMKLMKDHKVSPLGSCLPMLIQIPIFIIVYQAVYVYIAVFSKASFFWIASLASPDIPLLILYAISMIVTQKLTTTPNADPQQQMIQQQMTYIMPIFLVFVLYTLPSAFVLYWFFLNVFSAAHQFYLVRKFRLEDEAKAAEIVVEEPTRKGANPPAQKKRKSR